MIEHIKEGDFLNARQLRAYFGTTMGLRTKPCKWKTAVAEEFENYVLHRCSIDHVTGHMIKTEYVLEYRLGN